MGSNIFFCRKNFLKKKLENYRKIVEKHAPSDVAVILLMDNINMYRGNTRHQRLFKSATPKMWNFTVRGAIIPNCDDIDDLLHNKETSQHPQLQLSLLKADDLFIGMLKYSSMAFREALITFHIYGFVFFTLSDIKKYLYCSTM